MFTLWAYGNGFQIELEKWAGTSQKQVWVGQNGYCLLRVKKGKVRFVDPSTPFVLN